MQPKRSAPCSLTCYFRFRIRFVCCRRRNLTKSHVANAVPLCHSLSLAPKESFLPLFWQGRQHPRRSESIGGIIRDIGTSAHRHILGHRLQMAASFVSFGSVTNLVSKRSVAAFKELVLPKGPQIRNSCFVLIFAKISRDFLHWCACVPSWRATLGTVSCLLADSFGVYVYLYLSLR